MNKYMVTIMDASGTAEKRVIFKDQHFRDIQTYKDLGLLQSGGMILGENGEFVGGYFFATADSKQKIIDYINADIYGTSGVWDLSSVVIHAIKPANV
ncbi:hypothetical protein AYI68_g1818 [Smittium mucronatum]|uniref:YCII-related domain-containing protein n=1 Tax=Smittium mucronatum TaxID=133383 RepID=A0A1R0H4D3_9FUNG|nr:hypothetical protein AYI68_g1818 [Smittium mucronatum]